MHWKMEPFHFFVQADNCLMLRKTFFSQKNRGGGVKVIPIINVLMINAILA